MTVDYDDTPEGAPVLPRGVHAISAAEARELRNSPKYKKLKSEFRDDCSRTKAPCWLCGGDIDYKLSHPHPYAWSLDHAVTVKERPDLLMDPLNFRASHHDCNQARGTDEPKIDIGEPSETW